MFSTSLKHIVVLLENSQHLKINFEGLYNFEIQYIDDINDEEYTVVTLKFVKSSKAFGERRRTEKNGKRSRRPRTNSSIQYVPKEKGIIPKPWKKPFSFH